MGDHEKKDSIDSEATSVNEVELEKDVEEAGLAEKSTAEQPARKNIEFDQGEQHVRFRRRWYQLWRVTIVLHRASFVLTTFRLCVQATQGPTCTGTQVSR